MIGHSSLFSQLLLVSRHQFARRVKECRAEKAAKGFSCWSQFVAMMFCQLAQAKSLREISDGLGCCEGKLNHLGLQEGPKRSTLSYANAKRPWQLFEQVFYDQLSLAQSLAPKKKLRFKNKLLSLDASVIDLCLSMHDWATFLCRASAFRGNGAGSAAHCFVGAGAWSTEQFDKGRALSFQG